jgi:cytochrome c peroxidase
MQRQSTTLGERYDLANRPMQGVMMSGGQKPVQAGVRVKLASGVTWDHLAAMSPDDIKARGLLPEGFKPLPHVKQATGGQVFPDNQIDQISKLEQRDLRRFDVNFDLPDHLTPEFPPPIFLTTAPQLGDVSRGQLLSIRNFYEIMNGIITPVQMEGLRLLLTPFPQEEFNQTEDRKVAAPSLGVACLDCHSNFHTNAAFHLTPDLRPQSARFRLDTVSLRAQTSFLDNNLHDLKLERFYEAGKTSNDLVMLPDGPIKTFTLRGIKDSPPYMHDGRLLTLGDTVEFFNLVLGLRLTQQEKDALPSVLHHLQAVQALLAELTGAASAGPCDEFVVARQREIGSDPLEGQKKKSFRKALPAHASVHYVAKKL